MSYHMVAYSATVAATTETDLTPVTDGLMLIQNGHFVPQQDVRMLFAMACGAVLQRARIITPTLRQVTTPSIRPIEPNTHPGNLAGIADYTANPLTLKGLEEIQVDTTNSASTSGTISAVLGLSLTPVVPAPQGQVYTMLGTSATTLVAGAWTQTPVTWANTLPAGLYSCIGVSYIGATGLACRLTFENQWERPGAIAVDAETHQERSFFHRGGIGVLGQFSSYRLPTVECLATSADTAQTIFLDFVKVG